MSKGFLVSIEGPEGAGKTSLLEAILPILKEKDIDFLTTLAAGKLVIMDRFIDRSVASQGVGRGLDIDAVNWLTQFATDGLKPDLTLYFDIEVEKGLERIASNSDREVNRLDLEGLDLHRKVRQGYLSLLEKEGERIVKIDASLPLNQVVENTKQVLFDRMGLTE